MARTCRLTWASGTRICRLPYAHPGNCAEGAVGRLTPSLVAQDRYARAVGTMAPAVPVPPVVDDEPYEEDFEDDDFDDDDDFETPPPPAPVVVPPPPPPLDPVLNSREFLNAQSGTTGDWTLSFLDGGYALVNGRGRVQLPCLYAKKLDTCCGVLNIGGWRREWTPSTRAAFHEFVRLVRLGTGVSTMCIMSTTNSKQTQASELLQEAGFVETNGYNRNSGNMMSVWILRLYPERPE